MSNIGYRTFNGSTDGLDVNIGNIASASSLDCWIFAGRLLSGGADAEIVHSAGYDPLDWYRIDTGLGQGIWNLYDGSSDTAGATAPPADANSVFTILAVRRVASTVVRWSRATYSGSWSSFAHTNGTVTFGNRTYPSSGVLTFASSNPLNADFALVARCTSASDADINTLTTDLTSWTSLANLTNLWRFDGGSVVDLKGTATQNTLTGTSVTANGFPLDAGSSTVTGTVARTLGAVTSSASGSSVTGTVAKTLAPVTCAASGTFTSSSVSGTVALTIGAVTSAASGSSVTGTVARTLGAVTSSATGTAGAAYILSDDFPGSSIDTSLWEVYNRCGDLVNGEVNAVIPANVRVSGGSLLIDSKFEDVTIGDSETAPFVNHYTSGQVAQRGAPFLYGSVQVRAKIPGGTGTWPCIWMLGHLWKNSQPFTANIPGADWPNGGWWEIDIAEFMSGHRTLQNCALHFISANRAGSGEKSIPFDATTRFMVYRLDWTSTSLTWYIDAEDGNGWVQLLQITGTPGVDIPNTPGYLIIHTAVGGIGGTPSSGTFPVTFEVDYARVNLDASSPDNAAANVTLGPVTCAASGTFAGTVTGTVARTLGAVTSAAAGSHGVAGTVSRTLAAVTSSATGSSVTGAVAQTLAVTCTASGTFTLATVTGTVAVTLPAVSASAAGSSVTGSLVRTLPAVTCAASGTANPPGIAGNVAVTLPAVTCAASGTFTPQSVTGTISATLGAVVAGAAGSSVVGTLARTLPPVVSSASGSFTPGTVTGTVFVTLLPVTAAASGSSVVGSVNVTIGSLIAQATGTAGHISPVITGPLTLISLDIARTLISLDTPRTLEAL